MIYIYLSPVKKILLTALLLVSVAYAQKMKYVVAYCTLQGINGSIDAVFNGNGGSITVFADLDAKTIAFDWKMPDYSTVKKYTIVQSNTKKEEIYTTMGIYSIQLKCKNKDGKDCTVEIAINERINKIDIIVVDGSFVLNYSAVEVDLK
ncbi:MAG: hypothetical protein JWO92_441 [Chitinophagaceae bacterium]|nr:hypothetical protein [Chitinophagaceae bacterium]